MISQEVKTYAEEAIKYAYKFMPDSDEELHSPEMCLAVYVTSLAQTILEQEKEGV